MRIFWTSDSIADVRRLADWLAANDPQAASALRRKLLAAGASLAELPRRGARLPAPDGMEIRRLIVAAYEMRYAVLDDEVRILRIWHTRENR